MKHVLISTFLISTLSTWSVAQKPQTTVPTLRPVTTVETSHPATQTPLDRPQTGTEFTRPQTVVTVIHPATTVEVLHPQTTAEVNHPQTLEISSGTEATSAGSFSSKKGGKSAALPATSMSDFKPKQAKDFAVLQKAAPVGGGENKLGNDTNSAAKDAANKASLLGRQSNQNIEVDPKKTNLNGLDKALQQKASKKKK